MKHIKIEHEEGVTYNWQMLPRPIHEEPQDGDPIGLAPDAVLLYVGDNIAPMFEECSTRGKPRLDYEREFWVVADGTTRARYLEICALAMDRRVTVGWSYDDSGIGDLTVRRVVLWDIPASRRLSFTAFYEVNYPGVMVTFA